MYIFVFFCFFQIGYGPCSFSKVFFHEKQHFCVCRPYYHFSTFFRIEKDTHWFFAKICLIFSPWTPIWDHFVYSWMMSVQKQPTLKLKSVNNHLLTDWDDKSICGTIWPDHPNHPSCYYMHALKLEKPNDEKKFRLYMELNSTL